MSCRKPRVIAAGALGATTVVSTQASLPLETLAEHAAAPLWFQLYIQHDRDFTADLVSRAARAGYRALVVTVDAPVNGARNREQRAGFALPPGVEAVNLKGMAPRPSQSTDSLLFGTPLLAGAPTWADLALLRHLTKLPILLKGIVDPDDACRAIDLLPDVAQAVGGRVPVLMDGGIRRGNDVLRALALGASATLVGRPYIFALAAAGAPGVAHVLRILQAELELAMALTGCADVAAIDRSVLFRS